MKLPDGEFVLSTDEESEQFALYRNGGLIANGEFFDSLFEALSEHCGIDWLHVESLFLGDDERDDPPHSLAELKAYEDSPAWEKEARELEARAASIRERGKARGY